jgi:hypothetical protein
MVSSKLIDLKRILDKGDLGDDVFLQSGDLLYVPKNRLSKVTPFLTYFMAYNMLQIKDSVFISTMLPLTPRFTCATVPKPDAVVETSNATAVGSVSRPAVMPSTCFGRNSSGRFTGPSDAPAVWDYRVAKLR